MASEHSDDELLADLLARAEEAIARAAAIQRDSEVLVDISGALREETMVARCAWCSRYRIGERWVLPGRMPTIVGYATVTHSICEDCVDSLRESGMSA